MAVSNVKTLDRWCYRIHKTDVYARPTNPGSCLMGYTKGTYRSPDGKRWLSPTKFNPTTQEVYFHSNRYILSKPDPEWIGAMGNDVVAQALQHLGQLPKPQRTEDSIHAAALRHSPTYPQELRECMPRGELMYTLDVSTNPAEGGFIRHLFFGQSYLNADELKVLLTTWHAITAARAARHGLSLGDAPPEKDAFPPLRCRDVYDMLGSTMADAMGVPNDLRNFYDWATDKMTVQPLTPVHEIKLAYNKTT